MLKPRPVTHLPDCDGADADLSKVVCENGAVQYCEFCCECGQRSNSYSKRELLEAGIDLATVPEARDYRSAPCRVCGKMGVEGHHWACQRFAYLFPDFIHWPIDPLCREHHMEWHLNLTPFLVAPNTPLDELVKRFGINRRSTFVEVVAAMRDFILEKREAA